MPDMSDTGKWANRVVNNLLYYQTNYFISALIIFSLIRLVKDPPPTCFKSCLISNL